MSAVWEYDMMVYMDTSAQKKPFGFSEFHLKIIAYTTMFIDHVGAFVIRPYEDANMETIGYKMMRVLDNSYEACRIIGRIAFPLFCFMLVEGIFHTKNKWLYLARLIIFAGLSDIPFDLVNAIADDPFSASARFSPFSYTHQSVMITLSIGLIVLIILEEIRKTKLPVLLQDLLMLVPIACGALAAHFSNCDYGFKGVLAICGLYLLYPLLHTARGSYATCGGLMFFWEWVNRPSRVTASLSLLSLMFYNGEKGKSAKWFFYFFYPVHLLLLYGVIRWLIG